MLLASDVLASCALPPSAAVERVEAEVTPRGAVSYGQGFAACLLYCDDRWRREAARLRGGTCNAATGAHLVCRFNSVAPSSSVPQRYSCMTAVIEPNFRARRLCIGRVA